MGGSGCPICANLKVKEHQIKSPNGWGLKIWEEKSIKSKYFHSYKVYLVKIKGDGDSFYKVGRTFRDLPYRFHGLSDKYYVTDKKILFEGKSIESADYAYNLEIKLKKLLKPFKVIPKYKFDGYSECFNLSEDNLLRIIESSANQ